MRHFWQWFCGYICISLSGKQVNRFLNLCSRNGIALWQIFYDAEKKVQAKILLKDFYELKPYLRKTKTHLKILSKKGFPFWCYRHPKLKWGFIILFCLICLGGYSYTYIWNIDIKGNSEISTLEIMDYLTEQDIVVGKKQKDIDCSKVEYMLRQNFQKMGWVSVYFKHTNLCIEIKESLYDEFDTTETENGIEYDLVANKDAVINSIVTRSGMAVVKEGSSVKEGDVLVLGQCEIYDDNGEIKEVLQFTADALIYGDVIYHIVIPFTEMELVSLKISDLYSDDMLLFIANQKISEFIEKLEQNGVIILDKNVMIDKKSKNIVFIGEIKAREQIGITMPAEEVRENEFE